MYKLIKFIVLEQQNKIKLEEVRRKQQNYEKNKAKKRKCC